MNIPAPSWPAKFSPYGHFNAVPIGLIQEQFRVAWQRWGQPRGLRLDNGAPWGSWSDLPPPLALWLLGFDLELIWNDPHCPQQNGVVERSHRTDQNWIEPQCCPTPAELQRRLDETDVLQREQYPHQGGRTRWQLFPQLRHSGRPYSRRREERDWRVERVLDHLSGYLVSRQVDRSGKVSLYNRNHYVGVSYAYQTVYVRLDPATCQWIIADRDGNQLRVRPATELTRESIRSPRVSGTK